MRVAAVTLFLLTLALSAARIFPPRTNLTEAVISFLSSKRQPSQPIYTTSGTSTPIGTFTSVEAKDPKLLTRRNAVKAAIAHAWDAYATSAWGRDELLPLSRSGADNFSPGLGTTIVDSLSTLYLVGGLDGRYDAARKWVRDHLDFSQVGRVIVFETVIRILGGLISVYHMSGDEMYLTKAEELGARLAASFETPTGLPWPRCYLNETGRCESHNAMGDALYLAEVGSVQLEYRALSHHSRHPLSKRMRQVTEDIISSLQVAGSLTARLEGPHAVLLPYALSRTSGNYSTNMVTTGAPADSYFEYLVKVWVQGGRKEKVYWNLFARVVDSMVSIGSYTSRHGDRIMRDVLPSQDGTLHFSHKMDHFTCYIPGMIVLGLDGLDKSEMKRRKQWELLAEEITETCFKMYVKSPSGLAGEHIRLGNEDEWRMSGGYQLRPEAVEAFFYMYRHTKKEKYRDYAWSVFEQIERHCRLEGGGYAAIRTARTRHPKKEDVMHSFLISETFKYIYLIFGDDENEMRLDTWVFNTEAHPLLITPALGEEDSRVDEMNERRRTELEGHDEL